MTLVLISLGVITLLEILLWFTPLWRWRKVIACVVLLSLAVASGLLIGKHTSMLSILFGGLSLYRIVNLLRLVEERTQGDYLYHSARQGSLILISLQLLILGVAAANDQYQLPASVWWYGLALCQLAVAAILLASTLRHLRTTRPPTLEKMYADRELPTVTVAIPARNETEDLEACLQSLVASNYPKLEILVLDDCSQERRTPEIIRAFAHDGVRFIAGKVPPENWLAKNYAYQQLVEAASGEILLFCGVDVRFETDSVRALVETLLQKKKSMLSIIPRNLAPAAASFESLLVQPSRYAWELALPRRWLNRPPVLSTCWLIKRDLLNQAGGFSAVTHSISPESYFARQSIAQDDGYTFVRSDQFIALSCLKSLSEQRATAIRTRYPQLHRRPELAGVLSLGELAVLVMPFVMLIACLVAQHWALVSISVVTCLALTVFYARIVALTYQRFLVRGLWLLPFAALYDIALLNYSMWRYEFNEVVWKDRNICVPIMRAIPSLPKIN